MTRLSPNETKLVLLLCWCGLLLGFRLIHYVPGQWASVRDLYVVQSPNATLLFFGWNLFLAILPVAFAKGATLARRPPALAIWLVPWLLFLPNAPYLVSDLQHLRPRGEVPFLLDQVLFFSYAWAGVFAGGLAITMVADRLRWRAWPRWARGLSLGLFPLVGYGIYLGRVLRWNSWDLLLRPGQLFATLIEDFGHAPARVEILQYLLLYGGITWLGTLAAGGTVSIKS